MTKQIIVMTQLSSLTLSPEANFLHQHVLSLPSTISSVFLGFMSFKVQHHTKPAVYYSRSVIYGTYDRHSIDLIHMELYSRVKEIKFGVAECQN